MKCCICGKEIEGYGNNPWPVSTNEDDRCCDECNLEVILPERILTLMRLEKEKKNGDNIQK